MNELQNKAIDLTPYATDKRYRFISCNAFVERDTLEIYEAVSLPHGSYSAISYVWFGLTSSQLEKDVCFQVYCGKRTNGSLRENGGPINTSVLRYACRWSIDSTLPYLWLDRLCIIQTSRCDKDWQIERMYSIYKNCEQCIVLPGGLQRLASIYEETTWVARAWTYQEAMLTWDFAIVLTKDWRTTEARHWLDEGRCHWQYLVEFFVLGSGLLSNQDTTFDTVPSAVVHTVSTEPPRLIMGTNKESLDILERIMEYKVYNELTKPGEEKITDSSTRQLVLHGVAMRASSRPVDMAFSILGLVEVEEEFSDRLKDFGEDERFAATLALVEAMLLQSIDDEGRGQSTLIDVPLWRSIQSTQHLIRRKGRSEEESLPSSAAGFPSLQQLAQILDGGCEDQKLAEWKSVPMPEWKYGVTLTIDDPDEYATVIVSRIPEREMLKVYHGHEGRVIVDVKNEGSIELCRTLDARKPREEEEIFDLHIFGWSLRLENHPYIRFYKLDISHLTEFQ